MSYIIIMFDFWIEIMICLSASTLMDTYRLHLEADWVLLIHPYLNNMITSKI